MKRNLKCELTKPEIEKLKKDISEATIKLLEKEERLKQIQNPLKEEIKDLKGVISDLARKVKRGYEYRDIDCIEEIIAEQVYIIRTDTGENVAIREMTDDDRQLTFPQKNDA